MYLFISSKDSSLIHLQNNSCEFISELPKTINIPGEWSCALMECHIGDKKGEDLLICCDLVENSCVHGKLVPVLTIISQSGAVDHPYYVPICRDQIYRLRIRLLTVEGKIPSIKPSECRIVLHITKD